MVLGGDARSGPWRATVDAGHISRRFAKSLTLTKKHAEMRRGIVGPRAELDYCYAADLIGQEAAFI